MGDDPIIRVEGLWKRYEIPFMNILRSRLRKSKHSSSSKKDRPWALRGVSFELRKGEALGVIGRNGAGKSTLLKVLAGVTPPTKGFVEINGDIFPMIDLNAGIHADLTGRENVFLLGIIMGLTSAEIRSRIPDIEEFCELGEWFDRPVRKYSTGMQARLGFSVAMNIDCDIILIDEVLAVGDLAFRKKCYDRLEKLRNQGVSIILVSHSIRQIERLCDHVMILDEGEVIAAGGAKEITRLYYEESLKSQLDPLKKDTSQAGNGQFISTGEVLLQYVNIVDASGTNTTTFQTGDKITIELCLEYLVTIDSSILGVAIFTTDYIRVCNFKHELEKIPVKQPRVLRCKIPKQPLLPGAYFISIAIKESNNRLIFRGENLASFIVKPNDMSQDFDGLFYAPVEWEHVVTPTTGLG